eukprot:Colp12_sorted_trinity150504_noHs@32185
MPPTSTSRSSLWIPTTSPSETIPASTGSSPLCTSTARDAALPPPARSTEVCASRATEPTTPSVVPTEPPGRDATPSPCADTVKRILDCCQFQVAIWLYWRIRAIVHHFVGVFWLVCAQYSFLASNCVSIMLG